MSLLKFALERKHGYPEQIIIGVDEVGRGCLAGPVVAGACVLPNPDIVKTEKFFKKIKDSKLLSPELREELSPLIQSHSLAHGIASASVEEIDKLNILYASHLAMTRAVEIVMAKLAISWDAVVILVDGNMRPRGLAEKVHERCVPIIGGDLKCLSIACASVIAKVHRDATMVALDAQIPGYGFAAHKGYATEIHREALTRLGATVHHRRSFAPVRENALRVASAVSGPPTLTV